MKHYTIKELQAAYEIGKKDGKAQAYRESLRILARLIKIPHSNQRIKRGSR